MSSVAARLIGPPVDAVRLLHAVLHGALLSEASLAEMLGRFTPLGGALPGRPVTVAVFTDGEDEGAVEDEALAIALREQG